MATTYLSPGVYVEEIPSGINPIAGVGTSTAAFLGIAGDVPLTSIVGEVLAAGDGQAKIFTLKNYPVMTDAKSFQVRVGTQATLANDFAKQQAAVTFAQAPASGVAIVCDYATLLKVSGEAIGTGDGTNKVFPLKQAPVDARTIVVRVAGTVAPGTLNVIDATHPNIAITLETAPAAGTAVTADYVVNTPSSAVKGEVIKANGTDKAYVLQSFPVSTDATSFRVAVSDLSAAATNDPVKSLSQVTLSSAPAAGQSVTADYAIGAPHETVRLCTNFSEFKRSFGDFSAIAGQNTLAQSVYGFFNNGGSRCYVALARDESRVAAVLEKFVAIDDIALVAAPGVTSPAVVSAVITHCQQTTQDRFAILDCPQAVETSGLLDLTLLTGANTNNVLPPRSNYAAYYFPWIQVFDPATKGLIWAPPSGHVAGVYARVDTNRGVHKAPANEVVLGALDLKYKLSKSMQDGLNPQGVNCIRNLNGNIVLWGARTNGGDANGEWKYINVRRLFLFLRKSIDQGTQWVVFEPNDAGLWAKITRNITAFLLNVWRSGALLGTTPQEAFYVKCDAETNLPEVRDAGQVVTEIGVAVVKPAEFVIFHISQWAGPAAK